MLFCIGNTVLADPLRIAVASNFYSTLNLIKIEYEKKHPQSISLISGSTGKLYAQIIHGAPYDIFMAADTARPEKLEQAGLIIANSRQTYAEGKLALWSARPQQVPLPDLLHSSDFQKLAIANPKIAPYGLAAKQTLEKLGLYKSLVRKLVYGENIAQSYQFVHSSSADLGFVALSQLIPDQHGYWLVPEHYYSPIQQQRVILKSSKQQQAAANFIHFLNQDKIKNLIISRGYSVP